MIACPLVVWTGQARPSGRCVEAWEAFCAWLNNASRQRDLATRQLFAPLSLLEHILTS